MDLDEEPKAKDVKVMQRLERLLSRVFEWHRFRSDDL